VCIFDGYDKLEAYPTWSHDVLKFLASLRHERSGREVHDASSGDGKNTSGVMMSSNKRSNSVSVSLTLFKSRAITDIGMCRNLVAIHAHRKASGRATLIWGSLLVR
jgi:hypothetical protein